MQNFSDFKACANDTAEAICDGVMLIQQNSDQEMIDSYEACLKEGDVDEQLVQNSISMLKNVTSDSSRPACEDLRKSCW